jgi:hypothetical protein
MALAANLFSMQPSVIPFGPTPVWFCITVFMLMGTMPVVHWIMKRWISWRKEIALWMKLKRLEEEADSGREREYRNGFMADIYRDGTRGDPESVVLGTRAFRGRVGNFRNEESGIPLRDW